MNTPPRANMPPMSEDWRKWAEDNLIALSSGSDRQGNSITNEARISNSALDNISVQVGEIYKRQSMLIQIPDMETASFDSMGTPATVNQTIQIPRPEGKVRMGWISIQGRFELIGAQSFSTGYVTYLMDNRAFGQTSEPLPSGGITPIDWQSSAFVGYTGFSAGPAFGGQLTIRLQARGLAESGARSVRFTGIQATIQYGQAV